MSSQNSPCDWCVGVALGVFALSIAVIVVSTVVIGAQTLPSRCERIAGVVAIAGDCR